jgi:hypothetical protein
MRRGYGTALLAYAVARVPGGLASALPGCTSSELVVDAAEYRKMLTGTNGAHVVGLMNVSMAAHLHVRFRRLPPAPIHPACSALVLRHTPLHSRTPMGSTVAICTHTDVCSVLLRSVLPHLSPVPHRMPHCK